jgi:hypothetical protein
MDARDWENTATMLLAHLAAITASIVNAADMDAESRSFSNAIESKNTTQKIIARRRRTCINPSWLNLPFQHRPDLFGFKRQLHCCIRLDAYL